MGPPEPVTERTTSNSPHAGEAERVVFEGESGRVYLRTKGRRNLLRVEVPPDVRTPLSSCETEYPASLVAAIARVKGANYVCEEISRSEGSHYLRFLLRISILSYVAPETLEGGRILDFGCGCGASTAILASMFPDAEIVGVDLLRDYVEVARARCAHHHQPNVSFRTCPSPTELPPGVGRFGAAVLVGVLEHLMPGERIATLLRVWDAIEPGGTLFITDTPHRFFPVESHTTGLPFINYLPARLALAVARRFARSVPRDQSWEALLRRGIRGGTVGEILRILRRTDVEPVLLEPSRCGVSNRIELWYQMSSQYRKRAGKRPLLSILHAFQAVSGHQLVPSLTLGIQKGRGS